MAIDSTAVGRGSCYIFQFRYEDSRNRVFRIEWWDTLLTTVRPVDDPVVSLLVFIDMPGGIYVGRTVLWDSLSIRSDQASSIGGMGMVLGNQCVTNIGSGSLAFRLHPGFRKFNRC